MLIVGVWFGEVRRKILPLGYVSNASTFCYRVVGSERTKGCALLDKIRNPAQPSEDSRPNWMQNRSAPRETDAIISLGVTSRLRQLSVSSRGIGVIGLFVFSSVRQAL
jgi:hypothetical protein